MRRRGDDGTLETTGSPPPDTLVARYYYDGLHRRTHKARAVDVGIYYNYDFYYNTSWQVVEMRQVSQVEDPLTVATSARHQYVWDVRYIDAPVCRDEDKNSDGDCTDQGDEHLFYSQDGNFNTTALVDASDGSVAERYVYDPYGKVTIYDGSWSNPRQWYQGKQNEILFCGYFYDFDTGLYHVRFRMYHPTLGRWVQRDPVPYDDGYNSFQYVVGNTTGFVDPSGRVPVVPGADGSPICVAFAGRVPDTWLRQLLRGKFDWLFYSHSPPRCKGGPPSLTLCLENILKYLWLQRDIVGREFVARVFHGRDDERHWDTIEGLREKNLRRCELMIAMTCGCPERPKVPLRIPRHNFFWDWLRAPAVVPEAAREGNLPVFTVVPIHRGYEMGPACLEVDSCSPRWVGPNADPLAEIYGALQWFSDWLWDYLENCPAPKIIVIPVPVPAPVPAH